MLQFRVVVPSDRTDELVVRLLGVPTIHNVVRLPGAARRPDGDLVQFDVPNEMANSVITGLRSMGIEHVGSITVDRIDMSLSDIAMIAEAEAPGDPHDAVIWEEVEARLRDEATLSIGLVVLMIAAVLIAAVGILTDSVVLIVGAMVIGPEYGAISAMALGLYKRRPQRVARAAKAMAISFPAAILASYVLTEIIDGMGRTPAAYESGLRPLTSFISHPDVFSLIIAAVAAVAGTVSLTQGRSGALVGVLVSVTTIPAAANVGVALAHGRGDEAGGAAWQLVLNLVTIVVVSAATLWLEAVALRSIHRAEPPRV